MATYELVRNFRTYLVQNEASIVDYCRGAGLRLVFTGSFRPGLRLPTARLKQAKLALAAYPTFSS